MSNLNSGTWIITKEERDKHDAQFNLLNPVNDLVSGEKVRPVLMKSGLPISVLGHIWNLADLDGDGCLNRLEYSIAIHLIRHKLQGASLPLTLPNSLKNDPYKSPQPPSQSPPVQATVPQHQQQPQQIQQIKQQVNQQQPQLQPQQQPAQQIPQQQILHQQQPIQVQQMQPPIQQPIQPTQHQQPIPQTQQQLYQQQPNQPIQHSVQQPIQPMQQQPIRQPIQSIQQHQQPIQQPIQQQQQTIQQQQPQQPIQPIQQQQPIQPIQQQQPIQPIQQQQPIQPIQQQQPIQQPIQPIQQQQPIQQPIQPIQQQPIQQLQQQPIQQQQQQAQRPQQTSVAPIPRPPQNLNNTSSQRARPPTNAVQKTTPPHESQPTEVLNESPQSPEWIVKQHQIDKYRVVFKKIDSTNRGHLTGLEARAVLSKSGLPNKVLAQIWSLSDIDDDGCLNEEEFFLAMHFVEQQRAGQPIPATLPPECLPPSYRKNKQPQRPPPLSPKKPLPQKPPQPNLVHHTPPTQPKHMKPQQIPQRPQQQPHQVSQHSQQIPQPIQQPQQICQQPQLIQQQPQQIPQQYQQIQQPKQICQQPQQIQQQPQQIQQQPQQIQQQPQQIQQQPQQIQQQPQQIQQQPQQIQQQLQQIQQQSPPKQTPGEVTTSFHPQSDQSVEFQGNAFQDDPFGMSPMQVEQVPTSHVQECSISENIQKQWQQQQQQPLAPEEIMAYKVVSEVMSTLPNVVASACPWPEPNTTNVGHTKSETVESPATSSDEDEKRKDLEKQKRFEMEIERQKELDKKRKEEAEQKKKMEMERKMKEEEERRKHEEIERLKAEEFQRQKKEEFEKYRLAELEKQRLAEIEKQKQLEREKEEQRRKAQELKEAQLLEQQRQRQLDWEHQRRDQLILLKAREQNQVDNAEKEIARLKKIIAAHEKKKSEMESKLNKARSVLNEFTTTIDGMRNKRDQKVAEVEEATIKMEEKKRKLRLISQEAQLLETQLSLVDSHLGDAYKMVQNSFKKKQSFVKKLNEQLKKNEEEIENRVQLIELRNARLADLRQEMTDMHNELKSLQLSLRDKKLAWEANCQISQAQANIAIKTQDINLSERVEGWVPYMAMYEFLARTSDELSIKPGDVVWVNPDSIGAEAGWMKGKLKGSEGCFPEAYVQRVDDTGVSEQPVEVVQSSLSEASAPPQNIEAEITSEGETEMYVALYDYTSDEPGDLIFNQGEVIKVTAKDGEWWQGAIGSTRTGIFPANFVSPMPRAQLQQQQQQLQQQQQQQQQQHPSAPTAPIQMETTPKMTVMKKPEIATAIASYSASGPEQLSLQPGHLIQVRKKTDTGWWEGELQVRGQQRRIGWFPSSYVKLLGGARHSADNLNEGRSNVSKIPVAPAPEKMLALYDFTSDREDELTFKQGDVITVISKTHPDWWNGELDGAQGIFPANFVGPYKSA